MRACSSVALSRWLRMNLNCGCDDLKRQSFGTPGTLGSVLYSSGWLVWFGVGGCWCLFQKRVRIWLSVGIRAARRVLNGSDILSSGSINFLSLGSRPLVRLDPVVVVVMLVLLALPLLLLYENLWPGLTRFRGPPTSGRQT